MAVAAAQPQHDATSLRHELTCKLHALESIPNTRTFQRHNDYFFLFSLHAAVFICRSKACKHLKAVRACPGRKPDQRPLAIIAMGNSFSRGDPHSLRNANENIESKGCKGFCIMNYSGSTRKNLSTFRSASATTATITPLPSILPPSSHPLPQDLNDNIGSSLIEKDQA